MHADDDARFNVLARRHVVMPTSVLEHAPTARAIQVWALLALHADFRDTRSWPSVRRLSGMARCSTERVRDALTGLQERGLLEVIPGDHRTPNTYDLRPAWGVGGPPPSEGGPPPRTDKGNLSPAERVKVLEVVEAWRAALRPRAKSSRSREAKVAARLKEGYSVDELRAAIAGCALSEFHVQGHHTDLTLICRDAAHVDRFMELAGTRRGGQLAGRPPADATRKLSTDEVALNDTMQALAATTDAAERLQLMRDAEAIRLRIRAAGEKLAPQPDDEGE